MKKTHKLLSGLAIILFAMVVLFAACKKKEDPKPKEEATTPAPVETPDGQNESDNREVQSENDVAVGEINDLISSSKRVSGRSASPQETSALCFTVDSVKISKDTMLLLYNGVTCNNRTRTGKIMLTWQHGAKWSVAGTVIKVEYLNYKVVRASDQKWIELNGTQLLTNVSGGNWFHLLFVANTTLVNTVTGTNLNVKFHDGKTAVYNINRKITYTYPGGTFPNGVLTAKAEGIGSSGSLNNLENYGTARNGDVFTSQVTTPIIWNATCGGAVLQGVVNVNNVTKNASLKFTYGVDTNGNPVSVGANQCPYGWKLEWTASGNSFSKVFGYN